VGGALSAPGAPGSQPGPRPWALAGGTPADRPPWRHQGTLVLGLFAGAFILLATFPLLHLLLALFVEGAEGLGLLFRARPWLLLGRSVTIAGATTVLALAIGVPLGLALGRFAIPGRRILLAVHLFGFFLPPFLPALGWFHLFGRGGYLGNAATSDVLFSPLGVVLVQGLCLAPAVTALVAVALGNLDPALEEAALLVAQPGRVARRISLPLIRPAVTAGGLVVFTLALSELGVPMFLRVDVFVAAVFARLGGIDFAPGEAVALCLPLLPLLAVILLVDRRLGGARVFAVVGPRTGPRPALVLGGWGRLAVPAVFGVVVFSAIPLVVLAARAAGPPAQIATLLRWAGGAPGNSLLSAAAAATFALAFGVVVGHAAARGQRVAWTVDAVAFLGFILPAAVLGVGLLGAYNRAATQPIYGTLAIVVLAFVTRYTVVALRIAATTFGQVPRDLERAAEIAGASYGRRLLAIAARLDARGLAAAWMATFVFGLRDLETAVLIYPPGSETLTVRIFTLEANGPPAIVAGLSVVHVLLTAAPFAAAAILLAVRRRR